MRTRRSLLSALSGLSAATLAVFACTSSSGTPGAPSTSDTPDASGTPDASSTPDASPGGGSVSVAPTSGNVLTCDTLQLTETGGPGGGAWTVSPSGEGTVSSAGLYSAPSVAPSSPAVTVAYTAGSASGSAQLQVATAFPGTAAQVPFDAGIDDTTHAPFEHQLAANGSQVYAGLLGSVSSAPGSWVEADIFASSDNGATFSGPTVYPTGELTCATVAIDAGNANVVYLVYMATVSNTVTLRLAVSADGAQTFPNEYELADDLSNLSSFICPDVISPSPGHVVVAGYSDLIPDGSKSHLATFVSSSQGVGIGPATQPGTASSNASCDCEVGTDTNTATEPTCGIYSNGGNGGPRLITNGKGAVCAVYQYGPCGTDPSSNNVAIQCSQNSGATWSPAVLLGVPDTDDPVQPTGALSPGGKIAVAWSGIVPADAGGGYDTYVLVSHDQGSTFSAPVPYPSSVVGSNPTSAALVWENDTALWLSQITTDNLKNLYVDKTCDDGATWSGAVKVGTGGYGYASLLLTAGGVVAVADLPASISTFPLARQ